jgi:hypothetical protein
MAIHPAHDADAPGHRSIATRPAPDPSDDGDPRAERALSGVLFLAIATLIGLDVFEDVRAGSTLPHVGLETAVVSQGGGRGRAELSAFFLEDLLLPSPGSPGR